MKFRILSPVVLLLAACVALRLLTLGTLALVDPTEGRYAAIGQTMYLTNDWLVPRTFQNGILAPFLAKPPLHTWLTAWSYKMFGVSEFASRIPSFLSGVGMILCAVYSGALLYSFEVGVIAGLILLSSAIFFFVSGTCMIDPVLAFGVTAAGTALVAHQNVSGNGRFWIGILFFAALAIGALAKGPLVLALAGLAIGAQCFLLKSFSPIKSLPWIAGGAMFIALCIPWYWALEKSSPGFLQYFFINENLMRFLAKDYGDRYGSAHTHMYGSIWLMLFGAFAPWSFLWPFSWLKPINKERREQIRGLLSNAAAVTCLAWGLAPAILFTLAKQTSIYYVMPGLPWLAIISANALLARTNNEDVGFKDATEFLAWSTVGCSFIALALGVFVFDMNQAHLLIGLGLLGLYLFIFRYHYSCSPRVYSIARAATGVIVLFCVGQWALRVPINNAVSSVEVVKYVENIQPKIGTAGFARKVPQSAYFYARLTPDANLRFQRVAEDEPAPENINYVMIRNSNVQKNVPPVLKGFGLQQRMGDWEVFSRK